MARSRGGTETEWCCRQCNTMKADLTLEEWRAFMAANPRWWETPRWHRRGLSMWDRKSVREAASRSRTEELV